MLTPCLEAFRLRNEVVLARIDDVLARLGLLFVDRERHLRSLGFEHFEHQLRRAKLKCIPELCGLGLGAFFVVAHRWRGHRFLERRERLHEVTEVGLNLRDLDRDWHLRRELIGLLVLLQGLLDVAGAEKLLRLANQHLSLLPILRAGRRVGREAREQRQSRCGNRHHRRSLGQHSEDD